MKFASIFSDGAVIQRGKNIPVWGTAAPLSRIRCTFAGHSAMTVSGPDGRFKVWFPPCKAGTDLTLKAENLSSKETCSVSGLALGDVYLASGQSNMEFQLKSTGDSGLADAAKADFPQIRFFQIPVTTYPSGNSDVNARWKAITPETAVDFSAVAFYFARKLHERTNLPVGIILAARGGVNIEAFLSREALASIPEYAPETEEYDLRSVSEWPWKDIPLSQPLPDFGKLIDRRLNELYPQMPENKGLADGWNAPGFDDSDWESVSAGDAWTRYGCCHAGVFWYRKQLEIPSAWTGKELLLEPGAIDKADITYFNGVQVGSTGDGKDMAPWNRLRKYTVPANLVKAGPAVIAIRAASAFSIAADGGLIGPVESMKLSCRSDSLSLAGEWSMKMECDLGNTMAEELMMMGPGCDDSHHILFDNMIAPVIPYAVRGALWYQGEANAVSRARRYRAILSALIRDWRCRWGSPQFDFITIQLPGWQTRHEFSDNSPWAEIREAQLQASLDAAGIPPVVTIDTGSTLDMHPHDKKPVGERAAELAFSLISDDLPASGPVIRSCRRTGEKLRLIFETFGGELHSAGMCGEPGGFVLAGRDGVFRSAEAEIVTPCELEVSSAEVPDPVEVRYAWAEFPEKADLIGKGGLHASPFRIRASR